MSLINRIKLASAALVGKTYGINDMWRRGQYVGNVGLTMGGQASYADAYRSCSVAYACIDRISKDVAGIPLVFLSDPEDIESDVGPGDPLRELMTSPTKGATTRRLIGWSVMMRQLRGETIWIVSRGPRGKISINPWVDPSKFKEKVSRDEGLYAWTYRQDQREYMLDPSEVLWVGQDNPSNPYRGQSPLKAAADSVAMQVYGKGLALDMVSRGGERGLVLSTDIALQEGQYEQLISNLQRRRPGDGKATRDMIFDNGLKLENPDLTREDIDILAWLNASKDDICQVYGMAPVLIGDDDAAQYKSAPEAIRLYWQQTITPLLRSYEDAFDSFFTEQLGMGTYIRFDLSKVKALQRDEAEKAQIAEAYSRMGIPLVAINSKLGLGFDDADMEIADAYVPPVPPPPPAPAEEPEKSLHKGLTNETIRRRAESMVFKAGRERRRQSAERSMWNSYKRVAGEYRDKADKIVREALEVHGVGPRATNEIQRGLYAMQRDLSDDLVAATEPAHRDALMIGQASIQELVDGKSLPWHDRVKFLSSSVSADEVMRKRTAYIRANIAAALIDMVNDLAQTVLAAAGEEGRSVGWVASRLRDAWSGWSSGQARTIARTEVGTMYNVGRFDEMAKQGFEHHEWLTSIDEETRGPGDEFDHEQCNGVVRRIGEQFPCGLTHPQEDGGEAGNVINCRCETIPTVED